MELDYSLYSNNCLNKLLTARYFFIAIALLSTVLLISSYFIENFLTVEPCVLCAMQRILFVWILGTSVVGFLLELIFTFLFLKNFLTSLVYNVFAWFCLGNILLCSFFGVVIAGRQSWLQYFAAKLVHQNISSCSGGLEQLIMQHPISMVFKIAINGNLACSEVHFKILGLSLANWSMASFLVILLFNIAVIYKKLKRSL